MPARAATGDFEISPLVGPDGAAYLVRGGLLTCDSGNNCTGGLTGPKTETAGSTGLVWGNPTLQMDAGAPDTGFRGTMNFQVSGLPAGVTSQTAASTTITNNTILFSDPFAGAAVYGTYTPVQLSASNAAPLGNFQAAVTATSGSLTHSTTIRVDVVDSLPATTLARLEVSSDSFNSGSNAFGGTPASGTVQVSFPAPSSGAVVALASGNRSVASVPPA